jgi:hypothetical protein
MDNAGKTPEKETMDPELFKMLDEGLRSVFENNVSRDKDYGSNSRTSYGISASQAAQGLISLHRKFKPE